MRIKNNKTAVCKGQVWLRSETGFWSFAARTEKEMRECCFFNLRALFKKTGWSLDHPAL